MLTYSLTAQTTAGSVREVAGHDMKLDSGGEKPPGKLLSNTVVEFTKNSGLIYRSGTYIYKQTRLNPTHQMKCFTNSRCLFYSSDQTDYTAAATVYELTVASCFCHY